LAPLAHFAGAQWLLQKSITPFVLKAFMTFFTFRRFRHLYCIEKEEKF
jgi:hypothetical protein